MALHRPRSCRYPAGAWLGDRLLRFGMFAVVLVGDRLTDGDRQDRFPVELRGIQIVLDELEFLQELILLEIGVEVVQRHAELLVHLGFGTRPSPRCGCRSYAL